MCKCYNLFKCQLLDYCMFQMFNQITNRNNPNDINQNCVFTEIDRFSLFILQLCPVTIQITSNHDLTIISIIKVLTRHLYNYNHNDDIANECISRIRTITCRLIFNVKTYKQLCVTPFMCISSSMINCNCMCHVLNHIAKCNKTQ